LIKCERVPARVSRSVFLVLTIFVLLGSLEVTSGFTRFALSLEPRTTVTSPPVVLQAGTAGSSTIYENGTSAWVSVAPTSTQTNVQDYVDNNSSDVDGSAGKGSHSNFDNEKAKDNNYDTLTETSTASEWLSCNAYSSTYTGWTRVGASPYLGAQDQPTNYVYLVGNGGEDIGWFDFPSTTLTGSLNVNISIYCNNDDGTGDDYANVYVDYTGSGAGVDVGDVGQHLNWDYDTINLGSHTVSEVNNLRVYFEYVKVGGADDVRIDHVRIGVTKNCELDLEVQWTNVDYSETYELLCIYGGTMGAEDIRVDVWYNSAWQNVFTDLSNGWNNVSVTSYLTASTFTIRFKGGTESGDTAQHTWQIDAVLLHEWAGNEVLGSATTVTAQTIQSRSTGYGKDRVVLRTTDPSNTLHVFQIGDNVNNDPVYWWKSTDNGQTWSKQISSGLSPFRSLSVKKDSNNYIHIALAYTPQGYVMYKKQYYTDTSWASGVTISISNNYQVDVAIAPYNNNWVYVVYDEHTASGGKVNKVYMKISTDGGASFGSAVDLTLSEYTGGFTAGTFPSIVIDNTLGTYGRIYVTWFSGNQYLYLRRGNITNTGTVNWDSNAQTISSNMSSASTTENTNMMHSAMYVNGKYRVVYCESGTAKYRHWDESSWSSPISLATVSNYPSLTYDWNNNIYVFYQTNASNANYDIRYQRSTDTTPTGFGSAKNITANNNGNRYVSAKLGGDNNRIEFAWTYGASSPYQVKYNYVVDGGEGNFDHVLKALEQEGSNRKVRLKAYSDSNRGRLDNGTIYFYGKSQPITNMNLTSNANGWSSAHTSNESASTTLLYVNADDGTKTDWTRVGTSPYLGAIDYNTNYVNVSANSKDVGDFDLADSGKSTETINSVTVQIYARQTSSKALEVFVWDGSTWTSLGSQTLTTSWRWENYTATTVLNTWTKIDAAKIYLHTLSPTGTYEVDCARLKVDYKATITWTEVTWDSANGNPSPGSAGGSAYGGVSESSNEANFGTAKYNFSYTFTAPTSGWASVKASFAWKFTASGTYTNNKLNSVKLLLTDSSNVVLQTLYTDDNGGSGWTGQPSVGYYYRTGITVSASMTAGNSYKLKVQFIDTDTVTSDNPSLTFRIDDVGITFNYGNSNQIIMINGAYTQQTGSWYDLAASGTIYIAMYTKVSSIATSYIYVYLEIQAPSATTYARYIITFKIT